MPDNEGRDASFRSGDSGDIAKPNHRGLAREGNQEILPGLPQSAPTGRRSAVDGHPTPSWKRGKGPRALLNASTMRENGTPKLTQLGVIEVDVNLLLRDALDA